MLGIAESLISDLSLLTLLLSLTLDVLMVCATPTAHKNALANEAETRSEISSLLHS